MRLAVHVNACKILLRLSKYDLETIPKELAEANVWLRVDWANVFKKLKQTKAIRSAAS